MFQGKPLSKTESEQILRACVIRERAKLANIGKGNMWGKPLWTNL